MGRWLREPVVQCLLMGLALFVVYEIRNRDADGRETSNRIVLSADDIRQIGIAWVAQGRPAPSPEEMRILADARVREEILYREALALGLDESDAIVRRRLAQKMEFLFEDVAKLSEPTTDVLAAWFEQHAERFASPARVTFRHLYFSPDRRGAAARADAEGALRRLAGEPGSLGSAVALGDRFLFQDHYAERTLDDVARSFGPGFARAVFETTPGHWAGPVDSGYGSHLLWVDALIPARVPAFDEVEPDVRAAWIEEQRAAIREQAFEAMRARYEVVLPENLPGIDLPAMAALAAP
jgi:hypothetical protein